MHPAQPNRTQQTHFPPPDGINVADPAAGLPPTDAMQLVNMVRGEYGLVPRAGYAEWCTGVGDTGLVPTRYAGTGTGTVAVTDVPTPIPFTSHDIRVVLGSATELHTRIDVYIDGVLTQGGTRLLSAITPVVLNSACGDLEDLTLTFTGTFQIGDVFRFYTTNADPTRDENFIEVRTVMPFVGHRADGSDDRLFMCCRDGIYDCTSTSAAPTRVYTFATWSDDSGRCIFAANTNIAGAKFLQVTDEANGYILYAETNSVWTTIALGTTPEQAADGAHINGADPATFAFVMLWKNRVWFVERDSSKAWYLPIGQLTGVVTGFEFGNRFPRGGQLVGLWDWSMNGGLGLDSFLVAVSSAGDVLVYQGTDPDSASTFSIHGTWYCGGNPPAGRRIATDVGGDLILLTPLGILPLSNLVRGGEKLDPAIFSTRKIQALFNQDVARHSADYGWDIRTDPANSAVVVLMPRRPNKTYKQWAMATTTKGWSWFEKLPAACADVWHGTLFFGTLDGRACKVTGTQDNVARGALTGTAIEWRGLHSYQELGSSLKKQVQLIMPDFVVIGNAPSYGFRARYDFDLTLQPAEYTQVVNPTPPGVWDEATTALWDHLVWDNSPSQSEPTGIAGVPLSAKNIGSHVSLEFMGSSTNKCIYLGALVCWEVGGLL